MLRALTQENRVVLASAEWHSYGAYAAVVIGDSGLR